ncbi:hypothetical protein H6775_03755 [Candidatus Nomurabacteria bacterium]|nr:hypothetical protein [Candidatus Nomurabacteria bacterium]
MSYSVYVAKIEQIEPHPNADRLNIGVVLNNLVIVSKDIQEGELGLFFLPGGQISSDFLEPHDLYERKDENGKKTNSGYFQRSGKVQGISLRGVKTDGFWFSLNKLKSPWEKSYFQEGMVFSQEEDHQYITLKSVDLQLARKVQSEDVATRKSGGPNQSKPKKIKPTLFGFDLHKDTPRYTEQKAWIDRHFDVDTKLIITEKLHGTSQRTGRPFALVKPSTWWQKLLAFFGLWKKGSYPLRVGTRKVNLPESNEFEDIKSGYCGSNAFRYAAIHSFKDKIKEGECIYHEVVGWAGAKKIMGDHDLKKVGYKSGKNIYTYGCKDGEAKSFVYRITQYDKKTNTTKELSWDELQIRCKELGVPTVPVVAYGRANPDYCPKTQMLHWKGFSLASNDPSKIEGGPEIMEGLVLRFEDPKFFKVLKLKCTEFSIMEGAQKAKKTYEDIEEAEQAKEDESI